MDKPTPQKKWNELTPQQVDHFYRLIAERSIRQGDLAFSAWLEFAKYLFAANSGAAAGLFLLVRSSEGERVYSAAFFIFCAGTFFVGLAYFCYAAWTHEMATGWAADFISLTQNEITLGELDDRNHGRNSSWKFKAMRAGLVVSFLLLISGGVTAGKPFWFHPGKAVSGGTK